jgi:DNA-binding NarL/FixJ family response regulator
MERDSGHTGTIRVLLVDDDSAYLGSLQALIEQQPELTVIGVAGDGWEAVNATEQLAPDAIVVDLHMPNLDGVSTIRKLRQEHPLLCVIALTGDQDGELHAEAAHAGADGVLVKGAMLDGLVERLRRSR